MLQSELLLLLQCGAEQQQFGNERAAAAAARDLCKAGASLLHRSHDTQSQTLHFGLSSKYSH